MSTPIIRHVISKIGRPVGTVYIGATPAEEAAGVEPNPYYPLGHMSRYDVPTDGTSDSAPAMNKAIAVAAQVTSGTRFYWPAIGTVYRFTTQPNDINSQVHFFGDGKVKTQLLRDFNGSTPDDAIVNIKAGGEGTVISDMALVSQSGRSGGSLISGMSDVSTALTMVTLRNLRLTTNGTNTHDYAVYVDGSAKPTDPLGVRAMCMENMDVFGGSLGSVFLKSVVAFRALGVNTFDAGGTTGKVFITGDGTTSSFYAYWSAGVVHGFDLSFCEQVRIDVAAILGDIVNTSTAEDVLIAGQCTGTVQDNWTTSQHFGARGNPRLVATRVGLGGVTAPTISLEALGSISSRTSGSVTNVAHIGSTFSTVCPNGQSFTITTVNTLKDLRISTTGGAAVQVRGDFKTAALDLYDPSNEFENSGAPAGGQTGVNKSANSHVITIINNTGSSATYAISSVGNISSVTDPA